MLHRGILLIVLSALSFALMNVIVKSIEGMHTMQVIFFRCAGTSIFITPFMLYKKISFVGTKPKILLLRAVCGMISLATFFIVIQRIPLGSAVSLRYLGPIFGACLAMFVLKEKVNARQWASFFIAFLGVVVLKGFDLRIDFLSLLLALISAVLIGVVFVLIRYLTATENILTIINYFMLVSIVCSLFFIPYWRWPVQNEWYAVLSIGIFGLFGQIAMTKAFALEKASILAPFKYSELLFAMILGLFLFDESYNLIALLGIVLIVLGMIGNVYFKEKKINPN